MESEKVNGSKSVYLALYFIGAVLSGGGGTYAWLLTNGSEVVAPDRYTGTQATALVNRVDHIETAVDQHLRLHPDATNKFDTRIATLEAQLAIIIKNQDRILMRLDSGR